MKKAVYWIMGERAGRTIVGTWNWLWGMPVESGGKVAVAVAEESLQSMQEAVQKLAGAVAAQEGAYKTAKRKYEAKITESKTLEQQAMIAQRSGNEEAARMAMSKLIQTEQILPKLEEMVKQAETSVKASKDRLNRERVKLETYKSDMQNIKDMSEVNEALAMIAKVNNEFDIGSAKSDFEKAKSAVERRNVQTEALAELSENPAEKLQAEIENMTLDDEVARRLQRLQDSKPKQLPE
ncbi:PspA/IM30 family protein [Dolichospermum flos-aquae]|uniref:PspA/IM30 family protein n=1 Tax=Dolichospermum flos-aquae CCAP 1403/13F TaxID=315271 RepID=A0A6H2BVE5_DOLFA|nr:PspA/IM30 family protein [Dolichospermum flos-aquae]QJB43555.1 PspA/IM30 family protein [Dolichospermum flos-aquae CCAP 1403/13F]